MEAEKLLKKWEAEIDKRWITNIVNFYRYGTTGDFEIIRNLDTINFNNEKTEGDKIEAFIKICDNRIDRLKHSSKDLISILIALVVAVASILVGSSGTTAKHPLWDLLCQPGAFFKIIFLIVFLGLLALLRFRAQMYAWYAIKEGVLLMKKK